MYGTRKTEDTKGYHSIFRCIAVLEAWWRNLRTCSSLHGHTPTVIRHEVQRRGLKDNKALEKQLNGPPADSLLLRFTTFLYVRTGGRVNSTLEAWARREIIFRGDRETFKTAKAASDKFEHGGAHHGEVHALAVKSINKTAHYLRRAILELLNPMGADFSALLEMPYEQPMRNGGLGRQLHATLRNDGDEVAALDQAYPLVKWEFKLHELKLDDNGLYKMTITQSITPNIGSSTKLVVTKIVFAGLHEDSKVDINSVDLSTQPSHNTAGVVTTTDDPKTTNWVHPIGALILNCNTIRHLGLYWLSRLTGVPSYKISARSMQEIANEITNHLSTKQMAHELHERCLAAWRDAVELDEVRQLASGAVTIPDEGLIFFDQRSEDGVAQVCKDVAKIVQLSDRVVELASSINDLLTELATQELLQHIEG